MARIGARYDLSADALLRHLLADRADATKMIQSLDYQTAAPLEAAIVEATGRPVADFTGHRLPDLIKPLPCHSTRSRARNLGQCRPQAAWPRSKPAWCPHCVVEDVAAFGEVYRRVTWGLGAVLLCPRHQCLLISECPRCFRRADYQPINGRLRIWCETCAAGADAALPSDQIPVWPFGTPQQRRSCRAVSLSSAARPLLLRVQTDLLGMLAGRWSRGTWARALPKARVFDVLRKLTFVMLGPLWEGTYQAVPAHAANGGALSETWTPGSLPPQIAAPALLAAVTFLAAESGTRLTGITWHRDLLLDGEDEAITAETLLWHLDRGNAQLVRDLFAAPLIRPFALLLAALRADRLGQGAAREATRRRAGLGAARRRARENLPRHSDERAQAGDRTDRFSISRLIEGVPPAPRSPIRLPQPRAMWQEAVAVYTVLGWGPRNGDILAPAADWMPDLLRHRYVRLWIFRHRHLSAQKLISTLAHAIDAAHGQVHDIVLPELSAPVASAAPVKLAARGRPPPSRRSRDG
jgi:TniQ